MTQASCGEPVHSGVVAPPLASAQSVEGLIRVARRRLVPIVSLTLLVPMILLVLRLGQERQYEASSEVLISGDDLAASLTTGQSAYSDAQTADRRMETQIQLARVPALADRIVAAAGPGSGTSEEFLAASSAQAKPKADLLVLTVKSGSPTQAKELAGLYAVEFSKYRQQLDTTELEAVAQSLRQELEAIGSTTEPASPLQQDLQDKLRQIQTLQALQTSSAVVVRQPDMAQPVEPIPLGMVAGGLFVGLFLGAGLALLLELLDTRVRSSEEIADGLDLPLLGRLPEPPRSLREGSKLIMLEDPELDGGEAFSLLRANLDFANRARHAQVIMFTSAGEREGKSTTVANLAVAYARTSTRAAVLDLDFRRPSIDVFFGIRREPGITEVASGEARLEDALAEVSLAPSGVSASASPFACLGVLPSGRESHNIDVDSVGALIDRLRPQYDLLLVDTPPLLQVGDAMALTTKVDALVVVARLHQLRRPVLDELRRALETVPVTTLGYVATGATEEVGYYRQTGQFEETRRRRGPPVSSEQDPFPSPSLSLSEDSSDDLVLATSHMALASEGSAVKPATEPESDPGSEAPVTSAPSIPLPSREDMLAAIFGTNGRGAGADELATLATSEPVPTSRPEPKAEATPPVVPGATPSAVDDTVAQD